MSTNLTLEPTGYSLGFYARQPVFDEAGAVWAYSIYFREGAMPAITQGAHDAGATHNVLAALLGDARGRRLIIKFPAQSLVYELPLLLPSQQLVVEVAEDLAADPLAMDALRRLKAKGYAIAVGRFTANPSATALHQLADVLWVDALCGDLPELAQLARACRSHPALPALMRIETRAMRDAARSLGFKLFQGHFFQEPETICKRKLTSSQLSRLKLLQVMEQAEPDFKSLAETIRTDVALSFKLFGLLNSAHFSFPCQVQSVKQAIGLVGWEPLRTWIRLVILTDMTPAGKPSELPRSATLRGRFMERASQSACDGHGPGAKPDALFLVGLFSLLPAMLDQPMEKILETLCLPDEVADALTGRDGLLSRWLALAVAFERADWAAVEDNIKLLGLPAIGVATAYAQAVEWTDALYRSLPG